MLSKNLDTNTVKLRRRTRRQTLRRQVQIPRIPLTASSNIRPHSDIRRIGPQQALHAVHHRRIIRQILRVLIHHAAIGQQFFFRNRFTSDICRAAGPNVLQIHDFRVTVDFAGQQIMYALESFVSA